MGVLCFIKRKYMGSRVTYKMPEMRLLMLVDHLTAAANGAVSVLSTPINLSMYFS